MEAQSRQQGRRALRGGGRNAPKRKDLEGVAAVVSGPSVTRVPGRLRTVPQRVRSTAGSNEVRLRAGVGRVRAASVIRPGMLTDGQATSTTAGTRRVSTLTVEPCRSGVWSTGLKPTTYNRSWDQFLNRQNQWDSGIRAIAGNRNHDHGPYLGLEGEANAASIQYESGPPGLRGSQWVRFPPT